ncbi:heterokaryon incompatibility protein-domain-containing protein [Podospora australis]|uniref:Heterokaryon incompatibility protein-domain-containing protein n=1 Tax=Podospora australis TaxID=1536484 RepID=A0AAN7ADY1_9PEZI|nr:heterokaryon incompatibility protein-domain-containing protein [Podospora australis]
MTSLIVTLPYNYCTPCTDMLQRWSEPKPWGSHGEYYYGGSYPTSPESFLGVGRDERPAKWLWHISDLRSKAATCRCCNFILQSLNASPWMGYGEEDFVGLKPQLVGTKLSADGKLATPKERDDVERQFAWGNRPRNPPSLYDRYYRPMLRLYNKNRDMKDQKHRSHIAGDFTFILPLAESEDTSTRNPMLDLQTFHGRKVPAQVDFLLIQQWLRTCETRHSTAVKDASSPYIYRAERADRRNRCVPRPRRKVSNFRLIDVEGRCVVPAWDHTRYAALSYVWGHAKRLLLTSGNLEELLRPGALSPERDEVPRTFKDAIFVAERLGIPFLWIDALCVLQDDEEQLVEHMNIMDSIYSAAILTIVSDADSADSGIPGVSIPRGPPQATLRHGNKSYISSRRTFGKALSDSCWESRAWCLQEKVFSCRLLVFSATQAFYHCAEATFFEDTIMETRENNHSSVFIAERSSPAHKGRPQPGHTAYDAHQNLFGRNFWSLTEVYTQRQLSFESDCIRAFSGILASLEPEYGLAHWGIPEYYFSCGIAWKQTRHEVPLRRPEFPSWSWAGWRGNTGSRIQFGNVLTTNSDIWNIDWHYYKLDSETGLYELRPMNRSYHKSWQAKNPAFLRRPKHEAGAKREPLPELFDLPVHQNTDIEADEDSMLADSASFLSNQQPAGDWQAQQKVFQARGRYYQAQGERGYGWIISGHPGEEDYVPQEMPPFTHDPTRMPPLSQIIRFFTSCATLAIGSEPNDENYQVWNAFRYQDDDRHFYGLYSTSGNPPPCLGHIQLDPTWEGIGKEHEFIYVSPSYWPPTDSGGWTSTIIWIMLLEDVGGAPGVKRRVQLTGPINIENWRLAQPVWKCITLA